MRLLQSGMPKSGNFWLWQILQESIKAADLPKQSFIQRQAVYPIAKTWKLSFKEQADIDTLDILPSAQFYRISNIFRMPIHDFDAYLSQTNHVWTHSNFNEGSKFVFPKFDKIVYIVRDLRDVILSQSRFAFTDYRKNFMPSGFANPEAFVNGRTPEMSERWRKHVGLYLLNRHEFNIHIVFYERLLLQFDAEYNRLLDYLGIELSAEQKTMVKNAVQFETMQAVNPSHLQKGQSYKWMEQMHEKHQAVIEDLVGDLLLTLQYPLRQNDNPSLPNIEWATIPKLNTLMSRSKGKPIFKRTMRRVRRFLS